MLKYCPQCTVVTYGALSSKCASCGWEQLEEVPLQTLNAPEQRNEADSPIHSAFCECRYFWPDLRSTVVLCGSCGKPPRS